MSTVVMNKRDELIMKLVHYFITEENYNPIVVNGVKDEIWLENDNGPYRIIRINSNNIFNKEQLRYDYFKTESIVRQIKKKTLSFNESTHIQSPMIFLAKTVLPAPINVIFMLISSYDTFFIIIA